MFMIFSVNQKYNAGELQLSHTRKSAKKTTTSIYINTYQTIKLKRKPKSHTRQRQTPCKK